RRYFRLVGTSPWAWPDTVQDARLAECEALGYQLYQDLWAPAVPLLTREVILIPDGLLHYLPFPGLLRREVGDGRPQAEDYLLGRYNLRLHFSTALLGLTSVSRQSSGPDRLLGIAPTFDGDPSGLPPLYYNLREVTGLEERYRGHYLLREQGDKQAFLTRMNDYSVWHFSTHGYYDDAQPGASFLAFYHAGDRRTDNRLFAEEIAAMRIHPRLVVLSACETATGTLYRGEGLLSLARSFYQAGAPNILATRWRIDDAQSERLMTLFYEAMAEGMDSAAALREAQLAYLSESRGAALHPYYWAAFLHLGEGAEIGLRTPPSPWWWLAGVVALLVTFLIGRRSRSVRA
ncbi:MAG: CHAT domain-containing protein, partial [Lewinella sp.]|nr:CHAT domain-containing protein [Lewinella sp.]